MGLPDIRKFLIFLVLGLTACGSDEPASPQPPDTSEMSIAPHSNKTEDLLAATDIQAVISQYCVVCHNEALATAVEVFQFSAEEAVPIVPRLSKPSQTFMHSLFLVFCQAHELPRAVVENEAEGARELQGRTAMEVHLADIMCKTDGSIFTLRRTEARDRPAAAQSRHGVVGLEFIEGHVRAILGVKGRDDGHGVWTRCLMQVTACGQFPHRSCGRGRCCFVGLLHAARAGGTEERHLSTFPLRRS